MKTLKQNIFPILLIAAVVLIIWMFRSNKSDNDLYKFQLSIKDSAIQNVIRSRDEYRKYSDDLLMQLREKDSLLQTRFKTTVIQYEKIPNHITSLSKDSLRAAVNQY